MLGAMGWARRSWIVALTVAGGCGDFSPGAAAESGTDGKTEVASSSGSVDASSSGAPGTTAQSGSGDAGVGSSGLAGTSSESSESDDSASSSSSGTQASGPYPIVFAHGFFGFNDFAGAGFVDYFWGVREDLAEIGEVDVFTPAVDPFNNSTVRGEQLLSHVEEIIAQTGAQRVNIIGHSQGGLDARVVASLRPDLVASVLTISTPHGGTPIADYVLLGQSGGVVDTLVQLFGSALWGEIDSGTSLVESMQQFSEEGIAQFDEDYPDGPGVLYYSIAGRSDRHDGDGVCDSDDAPPFLLNWNGIDDPIDPLFAIPEAIVDGGLLAEIANDGLVRVADAKHGTFLGCIPADHVDEIGHLFGDGPGFGNPFDHHTFYRNVVGYLRAQAL